MEENIISMFMDVKLDIRERKLEFSHLKSWARYFVRVEAVKCFPCYMKISFFQSHNDESTDLVVRINIPGLTVQMATSRTRAHTYGLFWKNNRKRCCAYFALPSQLLCERHLRWMKKSIRNLELYRQEILQLRRASRTPIHEFKIDIHPDPFDNDLGIYQNLDITQNMVDVHEILGPLPSVPDPNSNSQRISSISGIYEEILDNKSSAVLVNACPRMSIASGIYEEMKLTNNEEQIKENVDFNVNDDIAPPLPPRPRSLTNEFQLQRSFTTPEADFVKKKKHWQLFDSMFSRRRTNSGSTIASSASEIRSILKTGPDPNGQLITAQKVICRRDVNESLKKNKRNSFSSPDLSAANIYGDIGDSMKLTDSLPDDGSYCSDFVIKIQDRKKYIKDRIESSEYLNSHDSSIEDSLANLMISERYVDNQSEIMNVSEKIIANFNNSCNSSSVNLVGFECTMPQLQTMVVPSIPVGYCEMGATGTGFNRRKLLDTGLCNKESTWNDNATSIYVNMNNQTIGKEHAGLSSSTSSGVSSTYSSRSSVCSFNKSRSSIDDKIPSYYPNDDIRTTKHDTIFVRSESVTKRKEKWKKSSSTHTENHYVEMLSPKIMQNKAILQNRSSSQSRVSDLAQKLTAESQSKTVSSNCESIETQSQPVLIINDDPYSKNIENNPPELATKRYLKYATISRSVSPAGNKCQEKKTARKDSDLMFINASKRFTSLPRFGRIDLSPLRLKISRALQRHNPANT